MQVVFHGVTTFAVLAITAVITSGYAASCQNLYIDVRLVFIDTNSEIRNVKSVRHAKMLLNIHRVGRVRFQFVQCCILADGTLCMIIVQKRVFDCIIS